MAVMIDVETGGVTCPRLFYNFLIAVDGVGTRDQAFVLRAAGVLMANEVRTCMHSFVFAICHIFLW